MALKKSYRKKFSRNSNATKKDVKKIIRSMIPKPELKLLPQAGNGTVGTGASIMVHLSPLSEGTSNDTRIGDKVTMKYFNMRFTTRAGVITAPADSVIQRIIIFRDKQANGAAPAALDLLETLTINSYYNLDNRDRFVVYKDLKVAVDPYSPVKMRSLNFKSRMNIIYPAAGVIPQTNSLYMLVFHDSPTIALQPLYDYDARLRFIDI